MGDVYLLSFLIELIIAIFWTCWSTALLKAGYLLSDASLALSLLFFSQVIFEIPTGYFADRYGRKLSTLSGLLLVSLGFLAIGFARLRTGTLLGFCISGVGITFLSGARIAWFLDIYEQRSRRFLRKTKISLEDMFLRLSLIGRFSTISGAFLGVGLLLVSEESLWIVAASVGLVTFLGGLFIESNHSSPAKTFHVSDLREMNSNNRLIPFALTVAAGLFFGMETGVRNLVWQPYVESISFGQIKYLAYFQSVLALVRILGIVCYQRMKQWTLSSHPKLSLILPLVVFGCVQAAAASIKVFWIFLSLYSVGVFTLGWFFPLRDAYLSQFVSERSRATFLSVDSMFTNLGSAIASLGCSIIIGKYGVAHFWYLGSALLLISAALLIGSLGAKSRLAVELSRI